MESSRTTGPPGENEALPGVVGLVGNRGGSHGRGFAWNGGRGHGGVHHCLGGRRRRRPRVSDLSPVLG
jgi:hypothetical protein